MSDEIKYIECEECGEEQAIHIGGDENNPLGWCWECTDCLHLFWCEISP